MDFNLKTTIGNWFGKTEPIAEVKEQEIKTKDPEAFVGQARPLFAVSYNGEKNLGEIGPIKQYQIDYEGLRLRSWQSYLESEISQTVLNKFATWVIGAGLKMQSDPNKMVLQSEKVNLDTESFNETTESRFKVFAESKDV